jgi:hypothetical protein
VPGLSGGSAFIAETPLNPRQGTNPFRGRSAIPRVRPFPEFATQERIGASQRHTERGEGPHAERSQSLMSLAPSARGIPEIGAERWVRGEGW